MPRFPALLFLHHSESWMVRYVYVFAMLLLLGFLREGLTIKPGWSQTQNPSASASHGLGLITGVWYHIQYLYVYIYCISFVYVLNSVSCSSHDIDHQLLNCWFLGALNTIPAKSGTIPSFLTINRNQVLKQASLVVWTSFHFSIPPNCCLARWVPEFLPLCSLDTSFALFTEDDQNSSLQIRCYEVMLNFSSLGYWWLRLHWAHICDSLQMKWKVSGWRDECRYASEIPKCATDHPCSLHTVALLAFFILKYPVLWCPAGSSTDLLPSFRVYNIRWHT